MHVESVCLNRKKAATDKGCNGCDYNFSKQCLSNDFNCVGKNLHGDGFIVQGSSPESPSEAIQTFVPSTFNCLFVLHSNLKDLSDGIQSYATSNHYAATAYSCEIDKFLRRNLRSLDHLRSNHTHSLHGHH